jgi:hypothetical protein
MNLLLRMLGAKKHDAIKGGKLWEVTTLGRFTVSRREKEPAKAEPRDLKRGGELHGQRVHHLKKEDDTRNMTRDVDFL